MLFLTFFLACDTIETQLSLKSPEEQLIDLRFEYKSSMDALYQSYGGNSLVETINSNTPKDGASAEGAGNTDVQKNSPVAVQQLMDTLKNTVKAQDRAQFEQDCLQIGNGHSVGFTTSKANTFFTQPASIEGCKQAALQKIKIQQLERQLQSPAVKPITPSE